MFEKLKSPDGLIYRGLVLARLAEDEFTPEPVIKELDGEVLAFEDHNTFIVVCEEDPFYSCVMHVTEYTDGTVDFEPIYDAGLIEELTQAGFGVQPESLEEARQAYTDFLPDEYLDLAA